MSNITLQSQNITLNKKSNIDPVYTSNYAVSLDDLPSVGGINVEELEVTENGTYTADQGKAYSPVNVSVTSGTMNYEELTNKPSINGVTLTGDKSLNSLKAKFIVSIVKSNGSWSLAQGLQRSDIDDAYAAGKTLEALLIVDIWDSYDKIAQGNYRLAFTGTVGANNGTICFFGRIRVKQLSTSSPSVRVALISINTNGEVYVTPYYDDVPDPLIAAVSRTEVPVVKDGSYVLVPFSYNETEDRPTINDVTLTGNKTSKDLGIISPSVEESFTLDKFYGRDVYGDECQITYSNLLNYSPFMSTLAENIQDKLSIIVDQENSRALHDLVSYMVGYLSANNAKTGTMDVSSMYNSVSHFLLVVMMMQSAGNIIFLRDEDFWFSWRLLGIGFLGEVYFDAGSYDDGQGNDYLVKVVLSAYSSDESANCTMILTPLEPPITVPFPSI